MNDNIKWAKELSYALNDWLKENGYRVKIELGHELALDDEDWYSVMRGRSVLGDKSVYAKIFLRTGLDEADPRKIPAVTRSAFGTQQISLNRAWSNREMDEFLQTTEARKLMELNPEQDFGEAVKPGLVEQITDKEQVASSADLTVGALFGQQVDNFLSVFAAEVAQKVVKELERRQVSIEPRIGDADSVDISLLTEAFLSALQPYVKGTSELRDQLKAKLGRELAQIAALTNILTQPARERESSLLTFRGWDR